MKGDLRRLEPLTVIQKECTFKAIKVTYCKRYSHRPSTMSFIRRSLCARCNRLQGAHVSIIVLTPVRKLWLTPRRFSRNSYILNRFLDPLYEIPIKSGNKYTKTRVFEMKFIRCDSFGTRPKKMRISQILFIRF